MSTARTEWPLASRSLTRCPPMKPPAPVTSVGSVTVPRLSPAVRKQRGKQLALHDLLHGVRAVGPEELRGALAVGAAVLVGHLERGADGGREGGSVVALGHQPSVQSPGPVP